MAITLNLPKVSDEFIPLSDRLIVLPQPNKAPKGEIELNEDTMQSMNTRTWKEQMQQGSLLRAIVLATSERAEKEHGISEGDVIMFMPGMGVSMNIDKIPVIVLRATEVFSIAPQLTEEEIKEWNRNQHWFVSNIWKEVKMPAPRSNAGNEPILLSPNQNE